MKSLLVTLGVAATAGAASADVLHDSTAVYYGGLYHSASGNAIGGSSVFGVDADLQAIDDFDVPAGAEHAITSYTGQWATFFGGTPSGFGLAEIFAGGGAPSEVPLFSGVVPVSSAAVIGSDAFGLATVEATFDLTGLGAVLAPGNYYISVQPMGSDWGYQYIALLVEGNDVYMRDAGLDHGNGFVGGYGTNDFLPSANWGLGPKSLSWKVEGEAVPAPAGVAVLALGGIAVARRRR